MEAGERTDDVAILLHRVLEELVLLDLAEVPRDDVRSGGGDDAALLVGFADVESRRREAHLPLHQLNVLGLEPQDARHGLLLAHRRLLVQTKKETQRRFVSNARRKECWATEMGTSKPVVPLSRAVEATSR